MRLQDTVTVRRERVTLLEGDAGTIGSRGGIP